MLSPPSLDPHTQPHCAPHIPQSPFFLVGEKKLTIKRQAGTGNASLSPQPAVELLDFGGNRVRDMPGVPALSPTPLTPHPALYTLHLALCTLRPAPYTLHPTPYTLHMSKAPSSFSILAGTAFGTCRGSRLKPFLFSFIYIYVLVFDFIFTYEYMYIYISQRINT